MRMHAASMRPKTFAQKQRIHRLVDALRSLDDHTLSQIGIDRDEIERFAHAEVVHNL
jgi:uncharacterized protein YjiS (DUF1127 family)